MTLVFIERDESGFVLVIEVSELMAFRCAKLSNPCKKPKAQILRADVGQKIWIQSGVFRSRPAYEDALAAADRIRLFAHGVSPPLGHVLRSLALAGRFCRRAFAAVRAVRHRSPPIRGRVVAPNLRPLR